MSGIVRVIPRLDIKGPNVVKGIQCDGYRVVGTAEQLAQFYYKQGADEIIYQDTVASLYQRDIELKVIKATARRSFVPLTVAGGIRTVDDVRRVLRAGADKVAINSAAVHNPNLIKEAAKKFGAQCIVASLEVYRQKSDRCEIWVDYGRQPTPLDAFEWARRVVELGAGEIMLTSINREGTGYGYDLELIQAISKMVPVPVIACGGAGSVSDFTRAVKEGGVDAVSASSVFHFHHLEINGPPPVDDRYKIRCGAQIDSGNADFVNFGYGAFKHLQVTPASIPAVKAALAEAGVQIR